MPSPALRWRAYFAERFPIGLNLVVATLFAGTCGLAALASVGAPLTTTVAWRLAGAALVVFLVFLHIRIFDEHKDYATDIVAFPERVLSRGWVTLAQLRRIGIVIIPLELLVSALIQPVMLALSAAVLGYSLLMLKEFWVAEWLKKHMMLYGVSHMAILVLQAMSVYASLTGQAGDGFSPASPPLLIFAGMIFCFGYAIEIARKIRPPEAEKPEVDTYSKLLGIKGALVATGVAQAMALTCLWSSGLPVSLAAWTWSLGVVGLAWGVLAYAFVKPNPTLLDKLDGVGAVPFLIVQITLIVTWASVLRGL